MIVVKSTLPGVYLLEPEPHRDNRGLLRRHYCRREMKRNSIDFEILQTNISENQQAYTLRGFHFQLSPNQEIKQIACVRGEIVGIVLDMRPESDTYKQWTSYRIDGDNRLSIIIPKGCANAYLTMKPDTWVLYYHSEYYTPDREVGIRYNDQQFNFIWPRSPDVISNKDLSYPDFDEMWFFEEIGFK